MRSLVVLLAQLASTTPAIADESLSQGTQATYVAGLIREHFPDNYQTMLAIARCESTGLIHRDTDGTLLRNQSGSSAQGVFQVLMSVHRSEMTRLGLDPDNDEDYMTYVRYLYDHQGLSPWAESRHCWGRA